MKACWTGTNISQEINNYILKMEAAGASETLTSNDAARRHIHKTTVLTTCARAVAHLGGTEQKPDHNRQCVQCIRKAFLLLSTKDRSVSQNDRN